MPITYTPVNNIIWVTAYSEAVPCTFDDIYNADKAGTYSLHARVGIGGIDGVPVAVTNALRPADYMVLGGTVGGDLYIVVTNWTANATINVVGTDRDGTAQNENIAVTANGTYNLTLWYKTVVSTQVTAFAGAFDYDLQQGQWGVVWKLYNEHFHFDVDTLVIGDGVAANSWFADTKKLVSFMVGATKGIYVHNPNSNLRLGELVNAGLHVTRGGCALSFLQAAGFRDFIQQNAAGTGNVYLYSSMLVGGTQSCVIRAENAGRCWNCLFLKGTHFDSFVNSDVFNVTVCDSIGIRSPTNTTVERLTFLNDTTQGIRFQGATSQTVDTVYGRGVDWTPANYSIKMDGIGANYCYIVDGDLNEWTISWDVPHIGSRLVRRYRFDLRVVDADGIGIQNVTVSMDDRLGANVFSVATDASGDIATQTIDYGYYEQATGDTIQPNNLGYSPHTVTISKPGYAPRTIVYTMDRKREEIEKLGGAAPHGMEYRRRRVPGLVSAMEEQ